LSDIFRETLFKDIFGCIFLKKRIFEVNLSVFFGGVTKKFFASKNGKKKKKWQWHNGWVAVSSAVAVAVAVAVNGYSGSGSGLQWQWQWLAVAIAVAVACSGSGSGWVAVTCSRVARKRNAELWKPRAAFQMQIGRNRSRFSTVLTAKNQRKSVENQCFYRQNRVFFIVKIISIL
jgi:hypothetical protein